jgi:NADP-dependent 3-hydroxy acid dehydrogenase YdfG
MSLSRILERLPKEFKDVTVLVNSAGIDTSGHTRFDEGKIEDWIGTIETNVLGLMRVSHAVIPAMIKGGRGHVINLGSISGIQLYAGGSIYTTSKFAVHGLSKTLRLDYLDKNIRVTEIMPGRHPHRIRSCAQALRQNEIRRVDREVTEDAEGRGYRPHGHLRA